MIDKPDPPTVGKVTHASIELDWTHVKKDSPYSKLKFIVQELSNNNKREWGIIYSGYLTNRIIEGLDPSTEYTFRLCVIGENNDRSEFSTSVTVRTTREPLNGELFHKAITLDRKSDIEKMLQSSIGERLLQIPDKFGNLPLMIAIIRNNFDIFQTLIEYGADVNAQNESLKTALMLAAFYGKLEFVKELRACNASYDFVDKTGMTVVHYAVDGGNLDVLQWILYDGADVNKKDTSNGWTPLLRAASVNASGDVARMLLKFNAKIDALDKENKSALLIATINGNLPFVKVLIEHGANFNTKNNFGKSLYDLAVSMDRKAIVKFYEDYMLENNLKAF
ncbi:unnamed protein product [Brachionus calyciflorus]|uniref:Fibronectin type-III domain-containing protein n=1 Tax=Brachionus calyciflorus TaxID=104777 RepID=A0A813XCR1_9BILA|nr:unnamed protein product [Brachionus calyciflorus]